MVLNIFLSKQVADKAEAEAIVNWLKVKIAENPDVIMQATLSESLED